MSRCIARDARCRELAEWLFRPHVHVIFGERKVYSRAVDLFATIAMSLILASPLIVMAFLAGIALGRRLGG